MEPITRQEILSTLVAKFGAVALARYYLSDALADLQSMEVGIAENNPMLAAKDLASLRENLTMLRTMLDNKDYRGGVEKEIKSTLA